MNALSPKRMSNLDIAKGIGIILMCAGHIYENVYIKTLIYSFHMPIFFIITGILHSKRPNHVSFPKYFFKKFKRIMVPYIIVEIIAMPLFFLKNGYSASDWKWIITDSLFLYYTRGGATWYLLNLFINELEFYWLSKIKSKKLLATIGIILFLTGLLVTTQIKHIFYVMRSFVSLGFILIGYLLPELFEKKFKGRDCILIALYLPLAIMNTFPSMADGKYNNVALYVFNSAIGSIIVLKIANSLSDMKNIITKFFSFYGINSMVVLCTHLFPMRYIIDIIFGIGPHYSFGIGTIIFTVLLFYEYLFIQINGRIKAFFKKIRENT